MSTPELPPQTLADLKAELAKLGQVLAPNADLTLVERPVGLVNVIVLDRVVNGVTPPYCCHGYASCIDCDSLCWLGHETGKLVESREALALCLDCAQSREVAGLLPDRRSGHVQDHLREWGPHE